MTALAATPQASDVRAITYGAVGALVDELVRAGAKEFCVCPGSRSTPLAVAIAGHPRARLWMHLDERSAAFFGLGLARGSGEPVVLVCTSGTAAANFFPAIVEASYSRVPLVILTADRPPELRENGAPQAIDQVHLYGGHVRWFFDLPVPEETPGALAHLRGLADRAVAVARGPAAGPVHLNCPYREPLNPPPGWLGPPGAGETVPLVTVSRGQRTLSGDAVAALAGRLAGIERGLIVCGPGDDPALPAALTPLAAALGYPILADPLSGLRCGAHDGTRVLDAYDAFLRDEGFAARHVPEVVLRLGPMPVSKPVLTYLQRHRGARHIVVDGGGGWNDPAGLAGEMLHADAAGLAGALAGALPARPAPREGEWLRSWQDADRRARAAIRVRLAALTEPFEGKVFAELGDLLPEGAALFAGNSMPVRDLDTFLPRHEKALSIYANRGANGIDGVVSSALGVAAAGHAPLVLVIGDVSFYHDSNGLLAARQHGLDATIVLLNNDGGGIFSFLPQATEAPHFESLFGTPHGLDFRPLAEMYGATYARPATWAEFRRDVTAAIATPGLSIVEVRTERARNVTLHREMWQAVSHALDQD